MRGKKQRAVVRRNQYALADLPALALTSRSIVETDAVADPLAVGLWECDASGRKCRRPPAVANRHDPVRMPDRRPDNAAGVSA